MDRGAFLAIIPAIQTEMDSVWGGGRCKVLDELAFMRLERGDLDDSIYAVARFGSASTNYAQASIPISLTFMGYIDRTPWLKSLLTQFSLSWNLCKNNIGGIPAIQFWNTPTVTSNFAEVLDGYCSLMTISGYVVFGEGSNPIKSITYSYTADNEIVPEPIDFLSASLSLNIANNTQPKIGENGYATSVGQYGTMTLSLSVYLTKTHLLSELLGMAATPSYTDIDKTYDITITFDDNTAITKSWRLMSFGPTQNIGALPMATVSFTI